MAETKRKLASQVGLPRLPRVSPTAEQKALARWATDVLRTLEDQGVVLTGVQDSGTLMPIRSVIDFIGASVTDDQTNDRTTVAIGGGAGAAPVNATYLCISLNGVLTNERAFVAGAGLAAVDGGANGNYTVNVGIVAGSHLVANADDLDWTGVTLRKNSGANVGTRRRINLIEGANVTITESDDAGNDEVDVTIAAAAASGPPPTTIFAGTVAATVGSTDVSIVFPSSVALPYVAQVSIESSVGTSVRIVPGSETTAGFTARLGLTPTISDTINVNYSVSAIIQTRAGSASAVVASTDVAITFSPAFPALTTYVVILSLDSSVGTSVRVVPGTQTVSGFTARLGLTPTGGDTITVNYVAIAI